ncbi:MAG TPA: YchJ family protein [Chromatiales bacterium]|nr:YchJ family protein [Chromatiales bacterium]
MQTPPLTNCPCGSGRLFTHCCGQYFENESAPSSVEELMRSRYSAYTVNNGHYLLKTWHPATRPASLDLSQTEQCKWLGLAICSTREDADKASGIVEFIARYSAGNTVAVIHETSRFIKEEGRWYYVDGTISQPSQNSACPCHSGKKFKRCCGKQA